jgi:signal transduction histidine kinase/CheY-like chemotaxis protein
MTKVLVLASTLLLFIITALNLILSYNQSTKILNELQLQGRVSLVEKIRWNTKSTIEAPLEQTVSLLLSSYSFQIYLTSKQDELLFNRANFEQEVFRIARSFKHVIDRISFFDLDGQELLSIDQLKRVRSLRHKSDLDSEVLSEYNRLKNSHVESNDIYVVEHSPSTNKKKNITLLKKYLDGESGTPRGIMLITLDLNKPIQLLLTDKTPGHKVTIDTAFSPTASPNNSAGRPDLHRLNLFNKPILEVTVTSDTSIFSSNILTELLIHFVINLFILLLVTPAIIWGINLITAPLKSIQQESRNLAQGAITGKIGHVGILELDNLIDDFNSLSKTLARTSMSKQALDTVLSGTHEMLMVVNKEGLIQKINPAVEHTLQYQWQHLANQPVSMLLDNEFKQLSWEHDLSDQLVVFITSRGQRIPALLNGRVLTAESNHHYYYLISADNQTDIQRTAEIRAAILSIKEQYMTGGKLESESYTKILTNIQEVSFANSAFILLNGKTTTLHSVNLTPDDLLPGYQNYFDSGPSNHTLQGNYAIHSSGTTNPKSTCRLWRDTGKLLNWVEIPLILTDNHFGVLGLSNIAKEDSQKVVLEITPLIESLIDILELNRLALDGRNSQELAMQNSKLVSLGELAAGVGHEINNPLAIATSHISRIVDELHTDRPNYSRLKGRGSIAHTALERIRIIVDNLRLYSRTDSGAPTVVDANILLRQSIDLVRSVYNQIGVEIEFNTENKNTPIVTNSSKFLQVLMNLISNAKDAVEKSEQKVIYIYSKINQQQVEIKVSDTGVGITAEQQERIFDLFYTTKPVGQGTGLGLGISQKIIREMSGKITVESVLDSGTTFTITLPLADTTNLPISAPEAIADHKLVQQDESVDYQPLQGRALLVDDEEDLREVLRETLEDLGLVIDEAESGLQALTMIRNNSYKIVYTDLKMPGMSGDELIHQAKEQGHNQIKYIIVTGGATALMSQESQDRINALSDGVVTKPFTAKSILKATNQALNRSV